MVSKTSAAEKGQAGGRYRMGKGFFSHFWIDFCKAWVLLVAVAILVWNFVVVCMFITANSRAYDSIGKYLGNAKKRYGGSEDDGYVVASTIPKQAGGMVWVSLFHASILVLILIAIATEGTAFAHWRERCVRFLDSFHISGMDQRDRKKPPRYYIIAAAFQKIFIVVMMMSQSFRTLDRLEPPSDDVLWSRVGLWSVYALLASILPTALARIFLEDYMEFERKK